MNAMLNEIPPSHGGNLAQAITRYRIPASDWLDLSAALNPEPYPPAALCPSLFQHLPASDEPLREAAAFYYFGAAANAGSVVCAPGSQALIQWLPLLRSRCRVAVPSIGYREHAFRWRWAGHDVVEYDARSETAIDDLLPTIDVLVVINPNNPLTNVCAPSRLSAWLQTLQQRQGWLVVDEAFADTDPTHSMAAAVGEPGLIVLRSVGKFFGLAGLRCGFALCEPSLANTLRVALGPWPVSGPTAEIAERALRDIAWQHSARSKLRGHSAALANQLESVFGDVGRVCHTGLFASVTLSAEQALAVQDGLARAGIWVRHIELDADSGLLRFGVLAEGGADWLRLRAALSRVR